MALSKQARDYLNMKQRERYANDPEYRERKIRANELYIERKAAEAAEREQQQGAERGEQ